MNLMKETTMNEFKYYSDKLKKAVDLSLEPVGVKFHTDGNISPTDGDYRFCQAVMEARHGKTIVITKENISCQAAAAALGLKLLPKNLQDGTMLSGYGIFKDKNAAVNVITSMPKVELGKYTAYEVKPLAEFTEVPDIVAIEDEVEKLMWIALAYLNEGGGRLDFSTSILQAICVDSVILPFLSGKINMSFGCYGCRDGTDALPSEGSLGFPGNKLQLVVENLEYLARQAIGRSRSKKVYNAYINRPKKEQANIQK